ncbi:MAG TPA: hypothetical protein VFQ62_10225 [Methylomirabilota bacterium]|nr:hypothetical protein [Methylomirabilota bacterium]
MPRRFVAVNVVLAAVSTVLIVYIARQLLMPTPLPVGGRRAAAATTVVPASVEAPRPPAAAYSVVAARNLFSPSRTESAMGTTTAAGPAPLVRPNLFGIVVRDGGSIAYLEDPVTKRVVGYRVGDKVIGGTVQTIKSDSVVIERPDGPMDVRLRDPGKPRTAAATGQPGLPQFGGIPQGGFQPGQPAQPAAALPGVIPPAAATPVVPPQVAQPQLPQPGQPTPLPGVVAPNLQAPIVPPGARRPLPPNLLRRLPPGMGNAPQQ